jgi:peptide subunit release factor 1 (eRF1)
VGEREVVFAGADGATATCAPPFPPLAEEERGEHLGFDARVLLEHVARERTVGVLLVRLGGHAAGVFEGDRLLASKVDSRFVKGRHKKGGSSSKRFVRRRENQERDALRDAAGVAARVLLPWESRLDALVLGGDRRALATVLEDSRLAVLRPLAQDRVIDVPDPRLRVLQALPERFQATVVHAGSDRIEP